MQIAARKGAGVHWLDENGDARSNSQPARKPKVLHERLRRRRIIVTPRQGASEAIEQPAAHGGCIVDGAAGTLAKFLYPAGIARDAALSLLRFPGRQIECDERQVAFTQSPRELLLRDGIGTSGTGNLGAYVPNCQAHIPLYDNGSSGTSNHQYMGGLRV